MLSLFRVKALNAQRLGGRVDLARGMRLSQRNAMLRIMLHQDGSEHRLALAGRLCGPWVDETETVWRSLQRSGEKIEIDMTDVTAVDNAGRQLLVAMHHAGARLIVKGVWMTALIEEIAGEQPPHGNVRRGEKNTPNNDNSRIRRNSK